MALWDHENYQNLQFPAMENSLYKNMKNTAWVCQLFSNALLVKNTNNFKWRGI